MPIRTEQVLPQFLRNDLDKIRVNNQTGSNIDKGTVVKVTGSDGLMLVEPAGFADLADDLSIAMTDILGTGGRAQHYFGEVCKWLLFTMDTSAGAAGDPVYMTAAGLPTLTAGGPIIGKVLTVATSGQAFLTTSRSSGDTIELVGTITSAQLLTMNATPVTIAPAPGTGLAWVTEEIRGFLDHGGTDYTATAGEDLQFRYTNGSGDLVVDTIDDTVIDGASGDLYFKKGAVRDVTPAANAPIVAYVATTEWADGDGDLKYAYRGRIVSMDPTA